MGVKCSFLSGMNENKRQQMERNMQCLGGMNEMKCKKESEMLNAYEV